MKICPTCGEEFSDQFKFCPVDSTDLSSGAEAPGGGSEVVRTAPAERSFYQTDPAASDVATETTDGASETTIAAHAPANGNGSNPSQASASTAREREEYHLTFLQDEGLTRRLLREIKEVGHEAELSWPEFKRAPFAFIRRGFAAYTRAFLKFLGQPNVAKGILGAFIGMLLIAGAILAFDSLQSHQFVSMKAIIIGAVGLIFAGGTLALLDRVRAKHNTAVAGIVVSMVLVLTGAVAYMLFENFYETLFDLVLSQGFQGDYLFLLFFYISNPEQKVLLQRSAFLIAMRIQIISSCRYRGLEYFPLIVG